MSITKSGLSLAVARAMERGARCSVLKSWRGAFVIIALLGFSLVGAATIGTPTPVWKIGRAVFEWRTLPLTQSAPAQATKAAPAASIPVLKLSLRNEGGAGNLPVQIFGRWIAQSAPPQSFILLGSYQQQVALVQTAIVEAPLTSLSQAPPGKLFLEIAVMTGGKETDRKSITWN